MHFYCKSEREVNKIELQEITEILKQEKENFINILPIQFQDKFRENAFISGGCIYSLRNNQTPKDFDFFVKDINLAEELLTYFKGQNIKPFKNLLQGEYNGTHLLITKYAISIGKYQIVIKYTGNPDYVVSQFDFKHNCYWYENDKINNLYGWDYLDSNKLEFNDNRVRDITGTIMRIPKFVKRGMVVSKKEIAKMLSKLQDNGFDEREREIIKNYSTY